MVTRVKIKKIKTPWIRNLCSDPWMHRPSIHSPHCWCDCNSPLRVMPLSHEVWNASPHRCSLRIPKRETLWEFGRVWECGAGASILLWSDECPLSVLHLTAAPLFIHRLSVPCARRRPSGWCWPHDASAQPPGGVSMRMQRINESLPPSLSPSLPPSLSPSSAAVVKSSLTSRRAAYSFVHHAARTCASHNGFNSPVMSGNNGVTQQHAADIVSHSSRLLQLLKGTKCWYHRVHIGYYSLFGYRPMWNRNGNESVYCAITAMLKS